MDAYTTEQRMKYVANLKVDKLVGNNHAKTLQIVEPHFDDRGSDLGPIYFVDIALRDSFDDLICHACSSDTERGDLMDTDIL